MNYDQVFTHNLSLVKKKSAVLEEKNWIMGICSKIEMSIYREKYRTVIAYSNFTYGHACFSFTNLRLKI